MTDVQLYIEVYNRMYHYEYEYNLLLEVKLSSSILLPGLCLYVLRPKRQG